MKTKLIEGVDARVDDTDILEAIAAEDEDSSGFGGDTMVIGIRNNAGQIYRAIHTDGLAEFMHTVSRLQGADLTDELEEEDEPRDGYDAIFS